VFPVPLGHVLQPWEQVRHEGRSESELEVTALFTTVTQNSAKQMRGGTERSSMGVDQRM